MTESGFAIRRDPCLRCEDRDLCGICELNILRRKEVKPMDNNKFEQIVKKVVADHHNASNDPGLSQITEDDVYIVWSCKTLQNNKVLASAPGNGVMYYELTYNGDKDELYVDAYIKKDNVCIKNPAEKF